MSSKKPIVFETTFSTFIETEIIGEGGSGRVYKASDETGSVYAIKLFNQSKASREKLKRFKNELTFGERNKHANIISVVDHGILKNGEINSPFYVMPFYPSSLRSILSAHIDCKKVLTYFAQILDGIEAAHLQRIIHRDLKPENILYDPNTDKLIVADFGVAHFEEEDLYTAVETAPNNRLANFQYAAPEQRARGSKVDHRADIYALGLMLNEMFTNEVPQGTDYKTIENAAQDYKYLDELVSAMLRQSPGARPESIEAIKRELIGRKQEFVTYQRISNLKQTVIKVTDVDDPLIHDPPRLVDIDWAAGTLTLFFQQPVNQKWIYALHNMGSYTSVMGKGPETFSILGNKATIKANEPDVKQIIDYFKAWLPMANSKYSEILHREKMETEVRQRMQLQADIEEQERRQRILKSIKF
jgi:serine/threonine protein kinase